MSTTAWPEVALGDLMATRSRSLDPTAFQSEEFDLYSIPAYDSGQPVVTEGADIGSAKLQVEPGDVLISRIVPHIRRVWVVGPSRGRRKLGSSEWIVFRTGAHPEYMRHLLASDQVHSQFMRTVSGVGGSLLRARPALVAKIKVPLPPIEEQRRIAAVLDRADELRAKRRAALDLLDTLTESIFDNMFKRSHHPPVAVDLDIPLHPSGWTWELLTDVARLATGHTPDRTRPDYWDGGIPWINLTEIRDLDGRIAAGTVLNVSGEGERNSSAVRLPAGTVCFSRTASIGFVTIMGREMTTSQDFVNWVCGDRLRPMYLMHALLHSRHHLRSLSAGSTHRTIYMRLAELFKVLVPALALQDEFVRRIEAVGSLRKGLDDAATRLDSLFASLQQRAFRGEL